MIARRRLCAGFVLVVVLLGAASIAISALRRPILRAAGWALVVNDRVEPSDVIVVTVEAGGAGALEAADLVRSGVASRVAVFGEPPDTVEREFIRRGIPLRKRGRTIRSTPQSAGHRDHRPHPDLCSRKRGRRSSACRLVRTTRVPLRRGGEHFGSLATSPPSASSFHEGPPDQSHGLFLTLLGVRSRPMVAIAPRDPN